MVAQARYRAILACDGVPAHEGARAAGCITKEFRDRHWHSNVTCSWDGRSLVLQADNDFDASALALIDEFSDVISACVGQPFDGDIRILSVAKL
jgi:hypothetical protein